MSNKMYDVLKWIAMVCLPAIATLYFALAGIWGFPYGEEVVGTITAVDTFLGVLLGSTVLDVTPAVFVAVSAVLGILLRDKESAK